MAAPKVANIWAPRSRLQSQAPPASRPSALVDYERVRARRRSAGPRLILPGAPCRSAPMRHGGWPLVPSTTMVPGRPDSRPPRDTSPVPLRRHGAVDLQFGQVHEEAAEIRCDGAVRPVRELCRQYAEADIGDARGASVGQRYAVEPGSVAGAEGTRRRDREGDPVH